MRLLNRRNGLALVLSVVVAPAAVVASEASREPNAPPASVRPELLLPLTDEYNYLPPQPGTYELPVIKPANDGVVLSADGRPTSLRSLMDGKVVVLSFIYTRCTDPRACMRATGVLSQLQAISRQDPLLSSNLLLLTLSFDPGFDTPEVMARYGRVFQEDTTGADWLFLTTRTKTDLQPLLESYGQRVDRRKTPGASGPYYHPLRVYLIDERRQIRNIYSYGLLDPRLVITDVRTLLMEPSQPPRPFAQIP